MIDIYELKATYLLTYLLTYQVLVPDGGTEPDVKTQNYDPLMKFDKYSPACLTRHCEHSWTDSTRRSAGSSS